MKIYQMCAICEKMKRRAFMRWARVKKPGSGVTDALICDSCANPPPNILGGC